MQDQAQLPMPMSRRSAQFLLVANSQVHKNGINDKSTNKKASSNATPFIKAGEEKHFSGFLELQRLKEGQKRRNG